MRHDIFSTPLWHIEGTPQQLVEELYQGAYGFKEKYPSENRSNQGGYQTPTFNWKSFHLQSKEYIEWVVKEHTKQNLRVQSWWYNINPKGAWNAPHTHPGADLALVLYLTDTDDLLALMDPNYHGRYFINNKMTDISPPTKKGDILIFPADLKHYVKPNQREEDRISISMNLQLC